MYYTYMYMLHTCSVQYCCNGAMGICLGLSVQHWICSFSEPWHFHCVHPAQQALLRWWWTVWILWIITYIVYYNIMCVCTYNYTSCLVCHNAQNYGLKHKIAIATNSLAVVVNTIYQFLHACWVGNNEVIMNKHVILVSILLLVSSHVPRPSPPPPPPPWTTWNSVWRDRGTN